jgi:hypothetical protein
MDSLKREIVGEVYRTLVLLGADNRLLGTIGSWGDGIPEKDVLSGLQAWNEATLAEIRERIGHYEKSSPHPVYSQAEARGTSARA